MKLQLSLIPHGMFYRVLPALMPYLEESAVRSRGRVVVDDLIRIIATGEMQLWIVYEKETDQIYGHFMTEVRKYPQMQLLVIQYAAMEPNYMAQIEDQMQEYASRFAKEMGCAGIEFIGRPGWKKHASKYGYEAQSVTYQKFFE